MPGIFDKHAVLKPSSMATVAERRFDDAEALCATNSNARANGAAYFAGFVIEILLKAQLVQKFPAIARKRRHDVVESELLIWSLIWRSHDLEEMLNALSELEAALQKKRRTSRYKLSRIAKRRVLRLDNPGQILITIHANAGG